MYSPLQYHTQQFQKIPKKSHTPPTHSPSALETTDPFIIAQLAFSSTSQSWTHTARPLLRQLLSLSNLHLSFIHVSTARQLIPLTA